LPNDATPLLNIPDAWRQIIYGGILVLAIAAYALLERPGKRSIQDRAGSLGPAASGAAISGA
jgi:ribose transport system ATP-binding protein